jgi:hypothetical protein
MKTKIILMTVWAFTVCNLIAQSNPAGPLGKTTLGFRAGVNFQNFNGRAEDGSMMRTNHIVPRFNAGLNVEIPIAVDFFLQPGLLFTTKGSMKKYTVNDEPRRDEVTISYIEMPINLVYKPLLGTGHLIVGFGPYVAYGIGGKGKYEAGSVKYTEKVKFLNHVEAGHSTDFTYFRAWDAGANLVAGYEFSNRLSFQLNFQLGMLKVNPTYYNMPNDQSSIKNTGFGLSLGYRL